jgi:hypothetical protein
VPSYGSLYSDLYPADTATGGGTGIAPPGWPAILVEAGFAAAAPGLDTTALILDDPVNGQLNTGTLGTATAWAPLTGYLPDGTAILQSVTITRSSTRQQGPLVTYEAGTATITLANSDGRFSPENLAGPYVSGTETQVRPMVPIRVRVTWNGITYDLFSGYVRSWTPPTAQLGPDYDYVVVEATDAFCVLEGSVIPATGAVGAGELSGARISRILAAAGWYDIAQGLSDIDPGQSAVQGTGFGGTALELLRLTADSEIGELYVGGAGQVTFRDRHAPLADARSNTVQAVFGDQAGAAHPAGTELPYTEIQKPDDDTTMANDIQATIAGSSSVQRAQDAASVAKFLFPRSYARSDLILQNDTDALNWASWVLYVSKDDEARFDSMTVQPGTDPDSLFPQVLGRELGDRIQVWRRPPGQAPISKDCFISSITHTATVDGWVTEWGLRDASRYGSFFTLDNATLGQLGSNALAFLRSPLRPVIGMAVVDGSHQPEYVVPGAAIADLMPGRSLAVIRLGAARERVDDRPLGRDLAERALIVLPPRLCRRLVLVQPRGHERQERRQVIHPPIVSPAPERTACRFPPGQPGRSSPPAT